MRNLGVKKWEKIRVHFYVSKEIPNKGYPLRLRDVYAPMKWVIIVSGNALSPARRQAITSTNSDLWPIGLEGTYAD